MTAKKFIANKLIQINPSLWEVDQVVIFDWYDGPREGLCKLKFPEAEFYFKLLDERPTENGLDDRLFLIFLTDSGTVNDLSSKSLFTQSKGDLAMSDSHTLVDSYLTYHKLLDSEGKSQTTQCLVLRTSDFREFLGCWEISIEVTAGLNWFLLLNL